MVRSEGKEKRNQFSRGLDEQTGAVPVRHENDGSAPHRTLMRDCRG